MAQGERRTRAVVCLGGDRTQLEPRSISEPAPGELLLSLRAVGLCGTDLFKLETGRARPGDVLGHEIVGEVTALGDESGPFRVGDRIVVPHHVACGTCFLCRRGSETLCEVFRENLLEPGGFSEDVLVRERAVRRAARKLPAALSDEAAVFLEPAACVLRGVRRSGLPDKARAVVLGAGSMGLLHVLVLKAARPESQVTVVDPLDERRALARELGADFAASPGEPTRDAVLAATEGMGADVVFDTVGGPGPLRDGIELTREGGAIVLFAHAGEGAGADFDLNRVFKSERRILGTYSGALSEQDEVFKLLLSGALDPSPLVSHRLALSRFADGVELLRRREALKVIYTPDRIHRRVHSGGEKEPARER